MNDAPNLPKPPILVPELNGAKDPAELEICMVNLHTRCTDHRCPEPSHLTDFGVAVIFGHDGTRLARTFSIEECEHLIAGLRRCSDMAKASRVGLAGNGGVEGDA